MTIHVTGMVATGWRIPASSAVAILLFETVFAGRFYEIPSEATETRGNTEDPMVAKGTHTGDPRSQAAEFAEFIAQIANDRSETAFDVLFRYFAPRIKSYCLRLGADPSGAEEVMQEAMVLVWRNAAQFDPSKASPSTWIFTIARNLSIDRFRKSRRPEFDPDDPALVPEDPQTPDRLVDKFQMEEKVRSILKSLSSNEKDVLMLSFYENLTWRDFQAAQSPARHREIPNTAGVCQDFAPPSTR